MFKIRSISQNCRNLWIIVNISLGKGLAPLSNKPVNLTGAPYFAILSSIDIMWKNSVTHVFYQGNHNLTWHI